MLIIESGVGMTDSESYIDLTYLQEYCTKRGIDYTNMQESNIVKAMDFFETNYTFKGEKLNSSQALEFPRLIDNEVVYPVRIKSAVCELALKTPNGDLLEDTERATIEETVGEITVKYDANAIQGTNYNMVYNLIAPYLLNTNNFSTSIIRTY